MFYISQFNVRRQPLACHLPWPWRAVMNSHNSLTHSNAGNQRNASRGAIRPKVGGRSHRQRCVNEWIDTTLNDWGNQSMWGADRLDTPAVLPPPWVSRPGRCWVTLWPRSVIDNPGRAGRCSDWPSSGVRGDIRVTGEGWDMIGGRNADNYIINITTRCWVRNSQFSVTSWKEQKCLIASEQRSNGTLVFYCV